MIILKYLICTSCGSADLVCLDSGGAIVCRQCGTRYRVINGIPALVPPEMIHFSEVPVSERQRFMSAKNLAYFGNSPVSLMYNHYHRYAAAGRRKCGATPLTLDIGSGIGEHYPFVTSSEKDACSFIGVDLDRFKLEHYLAQHPEIPLLQADAAALPLGDSLFDCVQLLATLEHFHGDQLRKVIAEAVRVLKPGGLLIACYPAEGSLLLKAGQKAMHALIRIRTGFDLDLESVHHHVASAAEIGVALAENREIVSLESSYYPLNLLSSHLALFVNELYRKR